MDKLCYRSTRNRILLLPSQCFTWAEFLPEALLGYSGRTMKDKFHNTKEKRPDNEITVLTFDLISISLYFLSLLSPPSLQLQRFLSKHQFAL